MKKKTRAKIMTTIKNPVEFGKFPVPNLGKVLAETAVLLKERFIPYLLVSFFQLALYLGPVLLTVIYFSLGGRWLFFRPMIRGSDFYLFLFFLISLLLGVVFVNSWGSAGRFLVALSGTKERAKYCLRCSLKKMIPLAWTQFLVGWFVGGLIFLALVIPVLLSFWLRSSWPYFLLVPFLLGAWGYGLHFIFAPYVVMTEGDKGYAAMTKSFRYTRGRFWPLLGRLTVLLIFQLLLVSAGSLFLEAENGTSWQNFLLGAVFALAGRLLPVFYLAVVFRHFRQGAIKKDSRLVGRSIFFSVSLIALVLLIGLIIWLEPVWGEIIRIFGNQPLPEEVQEKELISEEKFALRKKSITLNFFI